MLPRKCHISVWTRLPRRGNHKTMKCFSFFSLTLFSAVDGDFFEAGGCGSRGGGRGGSSSGNGKHLNKPSVEAGRQGPARFMTRHPTFPTQRPLSWASGGSAPQLLHFVTFVYSFFFSLSCSTFQLLSFTCIYLLSSAISLSGIFFSFVPSYPPAPSSPHPSSAPRHPGQLFVQTGCLQLSVQSGVAVQEAGRVACGTKLFPDTSVSSEGNIRDPSVTSTPQQPQSHPRTPHGGVPG